ncbi:MAG TPA: tetratricopeptide repeat protein [Rhizomicrobium sp.]|nr:tetratricopeptide repeat protein [Rhizomicrobium sp.]
MRRLLPLMALFLAGCAQQASTPAVSPADPQSVAFSTYLSARFAAGEHDLPQAARYYGRALANDPNNVSLLSLSFFYAITSGDFDAAGKYAQATIAASPDERSARLALAVIDFKRRDYAEVRKQLSLSAKGPFTILTLSLLDAWAAAAQHDEAGMQKDLVTLNAQNGAENIAAFHAALLQDYLGNVAGADAAYKKALGSGAPTPRVLEAYGRFLERNGRGEDAANLYHAHINEGGLASITGTGLMRIGKREKPESLVRNPAEGAAETLFGIAASLTDAQSADVSILYLRMALYLRPDLALAQVLLADRFETLRKFDSAILVYRAIDPSSPYYRMAQVQAALDEQRLGQTDQAVAGLKKLVASDPNDSESWVALGDTYRSANKFAESVDAYDHAEKAIPHPARRDWPMFYARAMAKEKLKQLDSSEADIQTALKLSPDQPELLNYLGYSWVDRGRNIPRALTMLEKARSLRPYDGYIVDSVGWAYFQLGRYEDAAKTLEAAVLLVPGDPTINDHLGDALWRAGRRIDARFQWNHALTFSDNDTDRAAIEKKLKTGLSEKPA